MDIEGAFNMNRYIEKIKKEYPFFAALSLLYGIIFTVSLYENISGITFPICIGIIIFFIKIFLKKLGLKLKKDSWIYITGMLLLGISTACTTSYFFIFFNWVGTALLLTVFMLHQFYDDTSWNFGGYLKRIILLGIGMIESTPALYVGGVRYLTRDHTGEDKAKKKNMLIAVLIGIVIAALLLLIIFPVLLSSDAIFAGIFGNVLKHIKIGIVPGYIVLFIAGVHLCYTFFYTASKKNFSETDKEKKKNGNTVIAITFTGIISAIYVLYCIIQIFYLFIGVQKGLPANTTYAEYARGGFWQLLFVCALNFIIVILCLYIFKENKILNIILTIVCSCTFIMLISAAYRMLLYIGAYHLTFLRILVLWSLLVLGLVMCGVVISIYKRNFPMFRYTMVIAFGLYIFLSFSQPDWMIAKYNITHIQAENKKLKFNDIAELTDMWSEDAAPVLADLKSEDLDSEDRDNVKDVLAEYFREVKKDQSDLNLRNWNLGRYKAKKAVENFQKGTGIF